MFNSKFIPSMHHELEPSCWLEIPPPPLSQKKGICLLAIIFLKKKMMLIIRNLIQSYFTCFPLLFIADLFCFLSAWMKVLKKYVCSALWQCNKVIKGENEQLSKLTIVKKLFMTLNLFHVIIFVMLLLWLLQYYCIKFFK